MEKERTTLILWSNYSNYTISGEEDKFATALAKNLKEQLITLWTIFIVIVLGNSTVLVAVCLVRRKKTPSRMNFYIASLAVADLMVGIFNVMPDLINRYTVVFYGTNGVCKVVRYLQATVVYASTYELVALSLDRYDAIVHPMNFGGRVFTPERRSKILVASGWVISFVLAIPSSIIFNLETFDNGEVQCVSGFAGDWQRKVYIVAISSLLFYIPLVIVTICYTLIIVTIWSKSKLLSDHCNRSGERREKGSSKNGIKRKKQVNVMRNASSRGLIPKAKIKTIKLALFIVAAFIACWLPFTLWMLLSVFGNIATSGPPTTILQNLPSLNSATNPLIYGLFSSKLCLELRRLPFINWLAKRCPCCEPLSPRHQPGTRYTLRSDTHLTELSLTEMPPPYSSCHREHSKYQPPTITVSEA